MWRTTPTRGKVASVLGQSKRLSTAIEPSPLYNPDCMMHERPVGGSARGATITRTWSGASWLVSKEFTLAFEMIEPGLAPVARQPAAEAFVVVCRRAKNLQHWAGDKYFTAVVGERCQRSQLRG